MLMHRSLAHIPACNPQTYEQDRVSIALFVSTDHVRMLNSLRHEVLPKPVSTEQVGTSRTKHCVLIVLFDQLQEIQLFQIYFGKLFSSPLMYVLKRLLVLEIFP